MSETSLSKLPETQIQKAEPVQSFGAKLIEPRLAEIAKVLPSQEATEAFARIAITALNKNKDLQECSPESILGCVFDLAAINLRPNTPDGHCYLIPYKRIATVQIGYKGFCELAYRSGNVKMIQADSVRGNEVCEWVKGAGEGVKPFVRHIRTMGPGRSKQPLVGAWASCELINGGLTIEILDSDEIAKIRKLAAERSPAWNHFEDEQAKKTAVKRMLKFQQLSNMETLHKAVEIDNQLSGIPINGIDRPAPAEHKLILTDEVQNGEAVVETEEPEEEEKEYSW